MVVGKFSSAQNWQQEVSAEDVRREDGFDADVGAGATRFTEGFAFVTVVGAVADRDNVFGHNNVAHA